MDLVARRPHRWGNCRPEAGGVIVETVRECLAHKAAGNWLEGLLKKVDEKPFCLARIRRVH
jgi:hypothetical protein